MSNINIHEGYSSADKSFYGVAPSSFSFSQIGAPIDAVGAPLLAQNSIRFGQINAASSSHLATR